MSRVRSTSVNGEEIFARDKSEIFRNASRFGFPIRWFFFYFFINCAEIIDHTQKPRKNQQYVENVCEDERFGKLLVVHILHCAKKFPARLGRTIDCEKKKFLLSFDALSGRNLRLLLDTTSQMSWFSIGKLDEEHCSKYLGIYTCIYI